VGDAARLFFWPVARRRWARLFSIELPLIGREYFILLTHFLYSVDCSEIDNPIFLEKPFISFHRALHGFSPQR
jgi:hypothetical protein